MCRVAFVYASAASMSKMHYPCKLTPGVTDSGEAALHPAALRAPGTLHLDELLDEPPRRASSKEAPHGVEAVRQTNRLSGLRAPVSSKIPVHEHIAPSPRWRAIPKTPRLADS